MRLWLLIISVAIAIHGFLARSTSGQELRLAGTPEQIAAFWKMIDNDPPEYRDAYIKGLIEDQKFFDAGGRFFPPDGPPRSRDSFLKISSSLADEELNPETLANVYDVFIKGEELLEGEFRFSNCKVRQQMPTEELLLRCRELNLTPDVAGHVPTDISCLDQAKDVYMGLAALSILSTRQSLEPAAAANVYLSHIDVTVEPGYYRPKSLDKRKPLIITSVLVYKFAE
jgi:hypothetical protein